MFHDVPVILLMMPAFAIVLMVMIALSNRKPTKQNGDAQYRWVHHHRERRRLRGLKSAGQDQGNRDQAA